MFNKGDEADNFYVMLHGSVELYMSNPSIKKLFSEMIV